MLLTSKSFCSFEINTRSLPRENFNFLTRELKQVEQWNLAYVTRVNCQYLAVNSKLSGRLNFPYQFKTKGMLLTAESFCDFVINAWSLPRENFNFLTQKLNSVEQWRVVFVTQDIFQYFPGILRYLEDLFSISF